MKIYIAGIPGAWSSQQLQTAFQQRGITSVIFALSQCCFNVSSGQVLWQGEDLSLLDGVVVRKLGDTMDPLSHHRVNLLYHLENLGVQIFSTPHALEEANNRYRMTVKLTQAGIPIPETIVTESVEKAIRVVEQWGKAVIKPLFTSKGRAMVLLDRDGPFRLTLKHWDEIGKFPFYLQRFVHSHYDVGMAILDGKLLGAYKRVAGESWQTTIREGGHYEPFNPDQEMLDITHQAANAFGLDYTVVDIVPYKGKYAVYEVSAFGGFSGLYACGIDATSSYAEYVIERIGKAKGQC